MSLLSVHWWFHLRAFVLSDDDWIHWFDKIKFNCYRDQFPSYQIELKCKRKSNLFFLFLHRKQWCTQENILNLLSFDDLCGFWEKKIKKWMFDFLSVFSSQMNEVKWNSVCKTFFYISLTPANNVTEEKF